MTEVTSTDAPCLPVDAACSVKTCRRRDVGACIDCGKALPKKHERGLDFAVLLPDAPRWNSLVVLLLSLLITCCAAQEDNFHPPKEGGACCVETHGEISIGTEAQIGKGRGRHY